MVSIEEIQAAYYMVAATGVLVAAVFYLLNLKVGKKNQELMLKSQEQTLETRKLQFITSTTQNLLNEEGSKRYGELMNMEWTDYGDFERKYGSDYNLDNYAKRTTVMMNYTMLGACLREELIDAESLYNMGLFGVIFFWEKFKGVIQEQARIYNGADWGQDIELLASEMLKVKLRKDPSFKVPEAFLRYVPNKV
jgi:hypothetical protein